MSDNADRIARVRDVYEMDGAVLLDLVMFDRSGEKLGRVSPAEGGPRSFEPACDAEGWERVRQPQFPLTLKSVPIGNGKVTFRFWAGERLPPADWARKPRPARVVRRALDDPYRRALGEIADGHNDARQRARVALGRQA